MINLIPANAKKSIKIEYWVRVLTTWLILWSVVVLLSAAILFPTYVLIGSQVEVYKSSADEASQKVASFQTVTRDLRQASQEARIIMDEQELPVLSEYIALFNELQGFDIELKKIVISRDDETQGIEPITLSGLAKDRQALASFRDRILEQEGIIDAELPISNLAQDRDIIFTITVVIETMNT